MLWTTCSIAVSAHGTTLDTMRNTTVPKRMTLNLLQAYVDQRWTYENFSPEGRLHIVCPHCCPLVVLFETLEPKVRSEIATLRRGGRAANAMRVLRQASGCDLRQAKANVLHIRDAASRCHKCQNSFLQVHYFAVNVCQSTWTGDLSMSVQRGYWAISRTISSRPLVMRASLS